MSTAAKVGTISFMPREVIFKEGEEPREFYLIKTGAVQLSRVVEGESKVIATLGVNEIFGESALFDGTPQLFTATALTGTNCMLFPKSVIAAKFGGSPEAALLICRSIFATMRNE